MTFTAATDLPIRRNTLLLSVTSAVYSAVLQLLVAVSSLTFVRVTGVEGLRRPAGSRRRRASTAPQWCPKTNLIVVTRGAP